MFYRVGLLYRSSSRVSFHLCGKLVSTPLRPHSMSRVISVFEMASTPSLQLQMQSRPSSRSCATTKPATSCILTSTLTPNWNYYLTVHVSLREYDLPASTLQNDIINNRRDVV